MGEPTSEPKLEMLKRRSFGESITLGEQLTPREAVEKLSTYHNTTPEKVIAAFINLRDFTEGTVIFEKYNLSNGSPCISMEGRDATGKWVWDHQIDIHSGQPIMRTS